MKIAEALIERADIQKRIEQLNSRLCGNARVQDGDTPAEDPIFLLEELDHCSVRLEELITRINQTNSSVVVDGRTITAWIAHRDCLTKKVTIMRDFLFCASQIGPRTSKTEILIRPSVPVAEIQKTVDLLSRELRETDTKIQAANWTNDLL